MDQSILAAKSCWNALRHRQSAAWAGGKVQFVSCVGDDPYADCMLQSFRDSAVDTTYVSEEAGIASGTALMMIGEGKTTISLLLPVRTIA